MEYTLKDKIQITKEFLEDLINKGWQEIDHLQNQINNIEENVSNIKLIQLFKNLLTSYYVFVGGLENLPEPTPIADNTPAIVEIKNSKIPQEKIEVPKIIEDEPILAKDLNTDEEIDPFEYFVDFDEPVGDPWTDADLYKN